MKKSFSLYFLVLSPLIFAQNELYFAVNYPNNNKINFDKTDFSPFIRSQLFVLDKNYVREVENPNLIDSDSSYLNYQNLSSLNLIIELEAMNDVSVFDVVHNPTLERFIRVYLRDRKGDLSKLIAKAEYYFPIFEEYLDKFNLPLEIKYLAIVESALIPNAISSSGAKGLWQFMLDTGRENSLKINSIIDERYNTFKSTEAACKYLSKLYDIFDDWDLALAAYNSGPGNVKKAIKRSGGKLNYWQIRQFLPPETRSYVPAFYATYYIFEHADNLNIKPDYSELSYLNVDSVHIKSALHFKTINKSLSIDLDLLKTLNPEYKKSYIPQSKHRQYPLMLPTNLITKFIENEAELYRMEDDKKALKNHANSIKITASNSYEVQGGDNLQKIAKLHHISLSQLKNWNGLQTNYLIEGQRLVIRTNKETFINPIQDESESINHMTDKNGNLDKLADSKMGSPLYKTDNLNTNFETYIVKEGDTLFNISRKFAEVSVEQLRMWNQLRNVKFLKPGTKLKIFKS